jgi:hypothetical protein
MQRALPRRRSEVPGMRVGGDWRAGTVPALEPPGLAAPGGRSFIPTKHNNMKPTSMICAGLLTLALSASGMDGVMMKDGKLVTKNGEEMTELTGERTLANGTKISATGEVTTADGKSFQLREGDLVADDGTFFTRIVEDGVVRKDGKVMAVKAGGKSQLTAETTLSDGTRIQPDGKVVSKAGKEWELDDGDAILRDGRPVLQGSIIVKDGKPLLVKECMGTPLTEEESLDGTKVRPDLAVTLKDDGGEATLKDGDIVKPDGTILRADAKK